jgi:aminopeptidase N
VTFRRHLGYALLIAAAVHAAVAADTYPRQPGVNALHYVFRLVVGDSSDEIEGEATVAVKFEADGIRELSLDLTSAAGGKGMTVSEVTATAPIGTFVHDADRLRIPLTSPSTSGSEMTVTVRYRGVPAEGLRFLANMHGERTIFSENWPHRARQWLPTIDHPYDKATGELIVTAPSHYQVVSNGVLVEEVDLAGDRRRTHWKQSIPIATWLYALGVARFAVHHGGFVEGVPLQTWVFPQDAERGVALFEPLTRRSMKFFAERIGPFSYEKLANVQAAGLRGATEHATSIFYGEKGVASGDVPVVHEVAHQWWGNSVTERDWDDVWLSEGFATYFTLLFTEHDEGREAFVAGLRESRDGIRAFDAKVPDLPVIHRNLGEMRRVLNSLVYNKGGWMLHMLRGTIGDEAFWRAMREYYHTYRNQNASTDELRRSVEGVAKRDLAAFFDQWLKRSGMPRVEGTWRYDAARKRVEIVVSQTQAGDPFHFDLDIGVVEKAGAPPRIERVKVTDRRASFSLRSSRPPDSVVLDPNTWLLMDQGLFERVVK